jgi:polyisoprenoid-binding protein YceI
MIQRSLAALSSIVILVFASSSAPAADAYKIDPDHTSIVFSVAHAGFSYTYGFFR